MWDWAQWDQVGFICLLQMGIHLLYRIFLILTIQDTVDYTEQEQAQEHLFTEMVVLFL